MAWGEELGAVIEGIECPNCGAPAYIRGKKKESSRRIETHITCEKCHLIKFHGLIKAEHLMLERLVKSLVIRRENATTEEDRERIAKKIAALEEKRKYKDLGL